MTDEPGIPHQTIDTLVGVWRSLSELGAPLTEEQWKSPSGLPGWTVQDTLSHIIGTERMLEGLPSAPVRTSETPWVRNPIGDLNENEIEARRSRLGAEVLAEWDDLRAVREATLAAGDAAYFARPMTTPTGPGTVADFLAVRILDCWIHEQDIRWALGVPGGLSGPAAEHTVDRLIRTIPIVVGKRSEVPEGSAVRVVVTDGVERDLLCQVNGGRAGFVDASAVEPLATVTFTTEAFVAAANGRDGAAAGGAVTIEGDRELGERVVANFNMMI